MRSFDLGSTIPWLKQSKNEKIVMCYLFICDGGDEPNWEWMAIGNYDNTVSPLSYYSNLLGGGSLPEILHYVPDRGHFILNTHAI